MARLVALVVVVLLVPAAAVVAQEEPAIKPVPTAPGHAKGEPKGESKGEPKGESKGEPKGEPKGKPQGEPRGEPKAETRSHVEGFKVVLHDHLMPGNSLVVVSLSPLAPHREELSKTGFYRMLAPVWETIPERAPDRLLGGGWVLEDLETVLSRGFTLAWTGLSMTGTPAWLAAIDLGDAEDAFEKALRLHMTDLRRSGVPVRHEMFRQGELWIIEPPDSVQRVIYTIREGTVIVGNRRKQVELAMGRLLDGPGHQGRVNTLAENKRYRSFCERQEKEGRPLVAVYVQPTLVVDQLMAMVPYTQRLRARQALGRLQLHKMHDLALTLRPGGGLIHELFWMTYPEPRKGLLAMLLGSARKVGRRVAHHVSQDATSVSVFHLSFRQVYESLISLSGVFSYQLPQQVTMLISNLETRAEVSVTKDMLDMLQDEVVVQQWRVPGSPITNMAMTIELHDAARFENAMERLSELVGVKRRNVRGTTDYSIVRTTLPYGLSPSLLVYKGHLVFATTKEARDRAMAGLADPRTNARIEDLLADLRGEPNSISWGNCTELGKELIGTLGTLFGSPDRKIGDVLDEISRALEGIGGEMVAVTTQDPEGFMVRSRSPYGNLYLCVTLSFGLRALLKDMVRGLPERDLAEVRTRRMTAFLKQIAAAQKAYKASAASDHNGNGVGEYGTMRELVESRCLPVELVGEHVRDGAHESKTYKVDSFLVKVLLPGTPDHQEERFAVIAWPQQRKRGLVFAITEAGVPQVNAVIAQAEGLDDCDPRDLFVGGRFDRPLLDGWLPIARSSKAPQPGGSDLDLTGAERAREQEAHRHYEALLEAEKTKRVTFDAIKALDSNNPDIAARAAYAMGMLEARNAVPPLCRLAEGHKEVRVRRQAIAALTKIGDPRSIATSIRALSDADATIRTYAATNLGNLRTRKGVKPLLDLLAGSVKGSGADHVAALLALAEIGDPDSLVPVSRVVRSQDPKIGEALAYLFQKLSPEMDAGSEIEALLVALDSRCMILRRYVIQRLGVLKDPSALTALENRLAKEDPQLQPLISVSLDAIRGHAAESISFKARMEAWLAKAEHRWQTLSENRKRAVIGSAAAVFLLFLLILSWRHRRRRRLAARSLARIVTSGTSLPARHPNETRNLETRAFESSAFASGASESGSGSLGGDVDLDLDDLGDLDDLDDPYAGAPEADRTRTVSVGQHAGRSRSRTGPGEEPLGIQGDIHQGAEEEYGVQDDTAEDAEGDPFEDWELDPDPDDSSGRSGRG